MSNKVIVVSTSPRKNSNSEALADEFIKGAVEAGNAVEKITLHNKQISFCRGCLTCWQTKKCVIDDNANEIAAKIFDASAIAFATPVYFYGLSGQMKTLLDRVGSLYTSDYKFRKVYLLAASANPEPSSVDGAIIGLEGWIRCFEKTKLCGVVKGLGFAEEGAIKDSEVLKEAYLMGKNV